MSRFSLAAVLVSALTVTAQAPVEKLTTPCCETLCAQTPPPPLPPYDGPFCERSTLTGDWLGCRSALRDCGWTLDMSTTQFYQGITDGGLARNWEYGGRADALLNIDGEKTGLWKGFFATLHGETIYGDSVNFQTGALSAVNTGMIVPVPNRDVTVLSGVKFTQFLSERFVTFFGKLNTLDDFKQPFAGYRGVDGFMNMAFNFPLVLARTIPYSTFAAGGAVLKDLEPVLTVMVLDTNNTPTTTGFPTFFDNGCAIFASGNLPTNFFGKKGHQGLMGSYSNRRFNSLSDLPYIVIGNITGLVPNIQQQTGSWALNYGFDQTVGTVCCDAKRTWGLFGNAGITDGNPNPIRWAANIGLGGSVPFERRPLDSFGVAYYYLGLSESVKNFAPRFNRLGDEQGIEAYYTIGLTPWAKITADLQVVDPVRGRVDTDVVFGVRGKFDF